MILPSSIVTVRMVITVSYTILPSLWIIDIHFVAEYMYVVVNWDKSLACHSVTKLLLAAASRQQQQPAAADSIINISVLYCYLDVITLV